MIEDLGTIILAPQDPSLASAFLPVAVVWGRVSHLMLSNAVANVLLLSISQDHEGASLMLGSMEMADE